MMKKTKLGNPLGGKLALKNPWGKGKKHHKKGHK